MYPVPYRDWTSPQHVQVLKAHELWELGFCEKYLIGGGT
jgi:hypothetical protein